MYIYAIFCINIHHNGGGFYRVGGLLISLQFFMVSRGTVLCCRSSWILWGLNFRRAYDGCYRLDLDIKKTPRPNGQNRGAWGCVEGFILIPPQPILFMPAHRCGAGRQAIPRWFDSNGKNSLAETQRKKDRLYLCKRQKKLPARRPWQAGKRGSYSFGSHLFGTHTGDFSPNSGATRHHT